MSHLPWLKAKKQAGVVVASVKAPEDVKEEGAHDPGLIAAAEDLLRAVAAKDADAVASALKAAFQIVDAEPHVEGEHV